MNHAAARPFRWYREPVVWLGTFVLLGAIGGCISLIRTASQHIDADLPDPVDRRARMQVSAERHSDALPAQASLVHRDGWLRLDLPASSPASLASLQLLFWNARKEHDLAIRLTRQPDGSYAAPLVTAPAHAMHVRIETPQRDDALIGEWSALATTIPLREPAR